MRIEHPLCDSIGRRKRKSVTPQFAECNSFVNLWTVGGRLQNARYFLAPIGGPLFGRETEVASEVWVRQMTKRAEPIVETGATLLSIALGNLRNFLLVLVNLPFALVGGVLSHFGS